MSEAEQSGVIHHTNSGYGPHPGNCPACVAKYELEVARRAELPNPHRVGTKRHAEWERENRKPSWYMDLRSEAYWSM